MAIDVLERGDLPFPRSLPQNPDPLHLVGLGVNRISTDQTNRRRILALMSGFLVDATIAAYTVNSKHSIAREQSMQES